MRQEHETATSFNQLKEITQIMQVQKACAKTSENAHASEPTQELSLKPKSSVQAKKGRLNPTKKAFSERQKTTIRDNAQANANANAKAHTQEPTQKTGLTTHQEKGGSNEA
ncbi:hypothetical protein [Helicobacter pylori]|uniref:hypothetical protein n=1 Tax=Helicobacter pylori TaxID=210 RepID=UPI000EB53DCF|nr:hypothetical protein [Helicobacter pylori]RKV13301.1 hypothetical protein DDP48_00740 [Helicobacter pylori]WQX59062.1 hypothetical protein KVJ99_06220 [Helicobacter pylori]